MIGRLGLVVAMALLLLGAAGCAPKEAKYSLTIVTTGCGGANPFQGVQSVRIRVLGDGITTPIEVVTPASSKTAVLPDIPAGANRVIEVRAYDNDPTVGGRVVSIGRTLPFTVPDLIDGAIPEAELQKSVILRQVGTWAQPVSLTERERCQSMTSARAAHTATLLPSGKVLIAGGFHIPSPNQQFRVSLGLTEIFDPTTGIFAPAKELSFIDSNKTETKLFKAFHTASLLPTGQVLVWGGESYSVISGVNVVAPLSQVLIYDAGANKWNATQRGVGPAAIPRTQHQAVVDSGGRVLVVGGLRFNSSGSGPRLIPVNEIEWFDTADPTPKVLETAMVRRVDSAAAAVNKGEFIAVAGGTDGTALRDDVVFFKWEDRGFRQVTQQAPPRLAAPGRRNAAAVSFRDGADMLVLGGYSDPTTIRPVQTTEVVQSGVTTVARGADIGSRGELCAVTLKDGNTVLAIGGRTADMNGMMVRSDATTMIVRNDGRGGTTGQNGPSLAVGRYLHTCTLLDDGSVLVTGGLNETAANPSGEVLNDVWIYTPVPTD